MNKQLPLWKVLCLCAIAALAVHGAPKGCDVRLPDWVPVVVPATKPTAATYVYEKDQHAIPAPVMAALDKLNRQGVVATIFEQDTTDGTGETPEQYKVPLAAAKEVGLPALAVTAGERVVRVVKDPKTEEAVIEAAQ